MTLEEIQRKLKKHSYKYTTTIPSTNSIVFVHDVKEEAIVMLMAMAYYGDNINLHYDKFSKEYKVTLKVEGEKNYEI